MQEMILQFRFSFKIQRKECQASFQVTLSTTHTGSVCFGDTVQLMNTTLKGLDTRAGCVTINCDQTQDFYEETLEVSGTTKTDPVWRNTFNITRCVFLLSRIFVNLWVNFKTLSHSYDGTGKGEHLRYGEPFYMTLHDEEYKITVEIHTSASAAFDSVKIQPYEQDRYYF